MDPKLAPDSTTKLDDLFQIAFSRAPNGVCLVDRLGVILLANQAMCEMFGYTSSELIGRPCQDLTHPEDLEETEMLLEALVSGRADSHEFEKRAIKKDGTVLVIEARVSAIRNSDGSLRCVVKHLRDRTLELLSQSEVQRVEESHQRSMHERARTDDLTGLPNQRRLLEELEQASNGMGVLLLDLDHFKRINDTHGHSFGDETLRDLAARFRGILKADDMVVRFGGDEFVFVFKNARTYADVSRYCSALELALKEPVRVRNEMVHLAFSAGVCFVPPGSSRSAEEVLTNADVALFRAKSEGRNRIVWFDEAMRSELIEEVQLEADFRKGIKSGNINCAFQPIVRLSDGELHAMEALARWQHPTRGVLSPDTFVELASRHGLLVALDRRVMHLAVQECAAWHRLGHRFQVAVNVATAHLGADLVRDTESILRQYGVSPESLCIELTEGALVENRLGGKDILHALRDLGVRLSIDDFGTGYSCLSYLKDLPAQEVKLDRSFISQIHEPRTRRVVAGIISLAHELDLEVVAEGIETVEQRDALGELGCEYGQGFFFARPSADPLAIAEASHVRLQPAAESLFDEASGATTLRSNKFG